LTTTDAVTHYTKAAGSCGTCVEGLEGVLHKVNQQMVSEGVISAADAFVLGTPAPVVKAAASKPVAIKSAAKPTSTGAGKLTNLQRIKLIEEVIAELRPFFKRDGGDCELVDVDGDHVFVKLSGACNGCQMESQTLNGVRERLSERLGRPTHVVPVHAKH
jgi:NifU-like protein